MSNLHDVVVSDDFSTFIVNKGDHVTRVRGDAAIETTSYALAMEIAGSVDGGDKAGILATTKPADYIPSPEDAANGDQGYYEYGYSTLIVDHGATITGTAGISATVSADDRDYTGVAGGQNDVELHNHGTITGTAGAALVSDDLSYFYVVDNETDGVINGIDATVDVLNNAGLIDGGTGSAIAGEIKYDSTNAGTITSSGSGATVAVGVSLDNSGTISATGGGAALVGGTITNEDGGVISAAHGAAIDASNGEINLYNAGEIDGDVIGGNDPVFGSVVDQSGGGTIKGDVLLGAGDDRFVGSLDAAGHLSTGVTGHLDGGAGTDTLAAYVDEDQRVILPTLAKGFEVVEVDAGEGATATVTGSSASTLTVGGQGSVVLVGSVASVHENDTYSDPATSVSFENDGKIRSVDLSDSSAVGFLSANEDSQATVRAFINKGTIETGGTAIVIDSAREADFTFDNQKEIIAHSGDGADVSLVGDQSDTITNSGSIEALTGTAFLVHDLDYEPFYGPDHATVANTGSITGTSGAFLYGADLVNSGSVIGTDGAGLHIENDEAAFHLTNSGTITGSSIGMIVDGTGSITNAAHSTIEGPIAIERGQDTYTSLGLTIHNAGAIRGDIDFGNDPFGFGRSGDHIINTGSIVGAVTFSDGADVLDSRLGTTNGLISGNGGNDLIRGGDNHTLADGGTGDDRIYGDGGDDRLSGGDDNDHLYGGVGNDRLDGGNGDDVVSGGDGNDVIIGGQGQDQLYGGAGSNTFVFQTAYDSPAAGWVHGDRIEDWHAGDKIDLHQIDAIGFSQADGTDHAFTFVGTGSFDGQAGELRFAYAGANTIVYADLDGDRHADFGFALKGHVDLHAGDFVL